MATASFHMKVKTHVDEAHNTHFDLQILHIILDLIQ